jgi:hypothetical protein
MGFSAYRTDVGYDKVSTAPFTILCGIDDGGFCDTGLPSSLPGTVNRSLNGDVVGFLFSPGVGPASQATVDIVIETNARSFKDPMATVTGSNGATATFLISGPDGPPVNTTMPEPSSVLLLSTGLLGLAGLSVKHGKRFP